MNFLKKFTIYGNIKIYVNAIYSFAQLGNPIAWNQEFIG